MFYVSFLIRNAVAEIDDSSGQPILATRAPPAPEELAQDLTRKQIIMSLDIHSWKVKKKRILMRLQHYNRKIIFIKSLSLCLF